MAASRHGPTLYNFLAADMDLHYVTSWQHPGMDLHYVTSWLHTGMDLHYVTSWLQAWSYIM